MKIYTKSGDNGETSLLGGKRVKKHHLRIKAYGTSDELNSWVGLIRDQNINPLYKEFLIDIQNKIFIIGSNLASLGEDKLAEQLPKIKIEDIQLMEDQIDQMEKLLPEMKNFILPGGNTIVSYCHIARTICRRCERLVTEVSDTEHVETIIIQFLNRLSDYLFVLARKINQDMNSKEISWISKE